MTDEQFDMLYSLLDTMNNNICVLNDNLNNYCEHQYTTVFDIIKTTNENIYEVGREVQDITSTLIRIEDRVRSFPY